ncbi:hypothetical protein KSB_59460 [Ktedonobacter robiniae]|uniref:Uncharacterized protein n=1 Tax=Ktedonobacter robiniae TaxID=2778365 RepID=A0ABQ3UX84_9CHLR|nr:hypothetical protein KSB_59460 [Ktedonobacter robiniae]
MHTISTAAGRRVEHMGEDLDQKLFPLKQDALKSRNTERLFGLYDQINVPSS